MFTFERIIRFWLPATIFAVCVVLLIVRHDAAGMEAAGLLAGGGGGIVLVNYIQRVGFAGDVDRHKESESREFLERYGMWPGQASPELIAQARRDGMLEHVVLPKRPGATSSSGTGRA
ncbi:hypothetical protein [Patulibacter minatonensis]|uniref:hypothetical protein n=1 Tax=Patulibacter minatonensis TaxID=298163 RepID=UPI0012FC9DE8|nr:hypothetical protein [Patulibacter minatonensis]